MGPDMPKPGTETKRDRVLNEELIGVWNAATAMGTIPLSKPIAAILEAAPRIAGSDLVFTTNGKTPISGWSRVRSRLQQEAKATLPWPLHDLRRSVWTGMNELRIEPHIVEAVLGLKFEALLPSIIVPNQRRETCGGRNLGEAFYPS
jgi:hypothetical protein